ncbi:hypothetical protein [Bifidobacterium biavatii]|uniref:Six-hairpin glycosidase n=1 Tax=Bifidobacterium biavatii DSM 23969 TaxID=1437608 RepID=A0A087A1L8_9BIFI|nr:hypothetical protein [Bifidobacterium biavatii]KFI52668.1 six-hairpin glycosidase [Bifidobacterium biavatii DSM 23969]
MYALGNNAPVAPAYADTTSMRSELGRIEIRFGNDPSNMNWLRPDHPYAAVSAPDGIESSVHMLRGGDSIVTTVTLGNATGKTICAAVGDIGITLPLEDRYYDDTDDYSIERHCNAHLFCGGTCSWALALRMSGKAPHLGLVLTEGALAAYSVSRDFAQYSNDRGCFVLHPEAMEFAPGQTRTISWVIFPCDSREDFFAQAAERSRFIDARWDRTVVFPGETTTLRICPSFDVNDAYGASGTGDPDGADDSADERTDVAQDGARDRVHDRADSSAVTVNGRPARPLSDGTYAFDYTPVYADVFTHDTYNDRIGEHVFTVEAGGRTVHTRVFVSAPMGELLAERVRFIVRNQQYRGDDPHLKGAYLAYDNEDQRQYYYVGDDDGKVINDYNAGRERVCMALLINAYLRALDRGVWSNESGDSLADVAHLLFSDGDALSLRDELAASLAEYRAFMERELVDTVTGEVFNDSPRDNSYRRLYNAPWFAELYVEFWKSDGDVENLRIAARILKWFYAGGGSQFYPLELPVLALGRALRETGETALYAEMRELFLTHARTLAGLGLYYPKHEVNYEQSIVAPAASVILQTAVLTGDHDLLRAGFEQLRVLDQFNGCQPDAHLNEVAIRHWDGFWFGKRKQYGDTFPHYWSGLTADVFELVGDLLVDGDGDGDDDIAAAGKFVREHLLTLLASQPGGFPTEYHRRAAASRRALLQLFFPDGTASCAYVFPFSVNGERTHFADPMANDQDWALYFIVRRLLETL